MRQKTTKMSDELKLLASFARRSAEHPAFAIVHYLLMCMMMREDFPDVYGPHAFCRRHPLASYIGTMVICFGGPIISNFVMAESVLKPFANHSHVAIASACWYALHFCPHDVVYRICRHIASKLLIVVGKEVHRVHSVEHGIWHVMAKPENSTLVAVCYSIVLGTGAMQVRIYQRLICGVWSPNSIEFMRPSLTTKMTFVGSLLFILGHQGMLPSWLDHDTLYLVVLAMFIVVKLIYFIQHVDVFEPFEDLFCYVLLGGVADYVEEKTTPTTTSAPPNPGISL